MTKCDEAIVIYNNNVKLLELYHTENTIYSQCHNTSGEFFQISRGLESSRLY